MNNTISTLSLSAYDILAVLIPGLFLAYHVTYISLGNSPTVKNISNEWILIFAFVIFSYVLGLLWKEVMEKIFNPWLRNNTKKIKIAYNNANIENNKKEVDLSKLDDSKVKKEYYKAYYYLEKGEYLGNIITLEKQIAFMRNIMPFLFLLPLLVTKNDSKDSQCLSFLDISVIIILVICSLTPLIIYYINRLCKKHEEILRCIEFICFASIPTIYIISCYKYSNSVPSIPSILEWILLVPIISGALLFINNTQDKIHELVWERYYYYVDPKNNNEGGGQIIHSDHN